MITTILSAVHLLLYGVLWFVLNRLGVNGTDFWEVWLIVICIGASAGVHGIAYGRRY